MTDITEITFGRAAPGIAVRDIAVACAFYTTVLGFRKVFENGNPVGFVIIKNGDAELHLNLRRDHQATTMNVAAILVSDATALYALCQAADVRIIKALRDHDYGLRAFVFADPDGNRIDVCQRL